VCHEPLGGGSAIVAVLHVLCKVGEPSTRAARHEHSGSGRERHGRVWGRLQRWCRFNGFELGLSRIRVGVVVLRRCDSEDAIGALVRRVKERGRSTHVHGRNFLAVLRVEVGRAEAARKAVRQQWGNATERKRDSATAARCLSDREKSERQRESEDMKQRDRGPGKR
jgi:hypothetical protein